MRSPARAIFRSREAWPACSMSPPAAPPTRRRVSQFEPLPRIRLAEPFERCAMRPTGCWPRRARGRKSFSPISDDRRLHRARDLRQEFLRGRRHRGGSNDGRGRPATPPSSRLQGVRRRSSPACARRTRSMGARPRRAAARCNAAGARHVYLAGRPGRREAACGPPGSRTFIYAGCDVLATLQAAHDILGVTIR